MGRIQDCNKGGFDASLDIGDSAVKGLIFRQP